MNRLLLGRQILLTARPPSATVCAALPRHMQERTNSELDVAAMVMQLDCGMSLKDIAECFKLDVKTVERLIIEYQRSPGSKQALE